MIQAISFISFISAELWQFLSCKSEKEMAWVGDGMRRSRSGAITEKKNVAGRSKSLLNDHTIQIHAVYKSYNVFMYLCESLEVIAAFPAVRI